MFKDDFPQISIDLIPFLKLADLGLPANKEKIGNLVKIAIWDMDLEIANKLRVKLEKLLAENKPAGSLNEALVNFFESQIILLDFICLPKLPRQKIEELFRSKLVFAMKNEVEPMKAVDHYYLYYFDPEYGVEISRLILQALGYNNEPIGANNIEIEGDKNKVAPAVANWLKSYNQFFEAGISRYFLQEGQYLEKNLNAKNLSKEDSKILAKLLQFYDFLRFPGEFSNFGLAEGETKLPKKLIGIPPNIKFEKSQNQISTTKQEIMAAYQGDLKQRQAIVKEEEKLKKLVGNDKLKLRQEFMSSVQNKNAGRTVACLKLLAQAGDLADFLKEDAKLNRFMANVWEKKFGKALVSEFFQNATRPKFVRMFLQYILEERLGMPETDAARVGLQIGNIFVNLGKKEYNKVAYYDVGLRVFKWFGE